jgi:hypothetical protein
VKFEGFWVFPPKMDLFVNKAHLPKQSQPLLFFSSRTRHLTWRRNKNNTLRLFVCWVIWVEDKKKSSFLYKWSFSFCSFCSTNFLIICWNCQMKIDEMKGLNEKISLCFIHSRPAEWFERLNIVDVMDFSILILLFIFCSV